METRIDVIKHLIKKFGYKSYLEIGVQYMACWNEIECERKVGVEPNPLPDARILPMVSDTFFNDNSETFDIIFIDGDHNASQAYRDINNAFRILNKGGCIVCHDTYPPTIEYTNEFHCGTVYQAICRLRSEVGVDICTYVEDFGVCVLRRGDLPSIDVIDITFEEFHKQAKEILNLQHWEGFVKHYE
jgi:SAM-dependent methyltransferase